MYRHLLAGPALRRTAANAVAVWIATATSARFRLEVYEVGDAIDEFGSPFPPRAIPQTVRDQHRLGSSDLGAVETRQLGTNLFVTLMVAAPSGGTFPLDKLLAYDVFIDDEPLSEHGLTTGAEAIVYGELALPSFFIASALARFLHGSCRKLHGDGEDALANADDLIRVSLIAPNKRPSVLLLTGDQIYADDVDDRVYRAMVYVANLIATPEQIPGVSADLSTIAPGSRAQVAKLCGFTSGEAKNHAMRFGEYAALYLLAWNPALDWLGVDLGATISTGLRAAIAAARRVLANIPTYMMFDDHEITDDWNLNTEWKRTVQKSPAGRRIIANGLAAYWAFQGWANQPDSYDSAFKDQIERYLSGAELDAGDTYDTLLWSFARWAYTTPTKPAVAFPDFRTMRGRRQNHFRAVELLDKDRYQLVDQLLDSAGYQPGSPLILVTGTPVFGHPIAERLQEEIAATGDPYTADTESWVSNGHGLPRLMAFIARKTRGGVCIILSGDVHFGFHAIAQYRDRARTAAIAQVTSSSLKNSGSMPRGLAIADLVLGTSVQHDVGWNDRPAGIIDILNRAVVALVPVVIAELGLSGFEATSPPLLVWRTAARLFEKSEPPPAGAYARFAVLFRALRRMQRSDDPLKLPWEVAKLLELPAPSWEVMRSFVPVTSAAGERQHVIGDTNLGDLTAFLKRKSISSALTTRSGGRISDRPRALIDLTPSAQVRGSSALNRESLAARRDLAESDPGEAVALHLIEWYRRNRDDAWNKSVLPFADFRLEGLPRSFLPAGRADLMKCQVHAVAFRRAGTSIRQLSDELLSSFSQLIPPAEGRAIPHPEGKLALGSEIRWLINPPLYTPEVQRALQLLIPRIRRLALTEPTDRILKFELEELVIKNDPILRRFDVRIREVQGPTDSWFAFTVETLSNHPYGARRTWSLQRGPGDDLYQFVTVEFNSYAWLIDITVELALEAGPTRRMWTGMLGSFVAAGGGQVTALADPVLAERIRDPAIGIAEDTSYLYPEIINQSPLGNWIRGRYSSIGSMVNDVYGAPS